MPGKLIIGREGLVAMTVTRVTGRASLWRRASTSNARVWAVVGALVVAVAVAAVTVTAVTGSGSPVSLNGPLRTSPMPGSVVECVPTSPGSRNATATVTVLTVPRAAGALTLRGLDLVGGRGVQVIASVIVRQGHAGVGFWRGYPPTVKDLGAAAGAWAQRVPLVGAPLRAAHARNASFDVVLGLHLTAPVAGAFKYATLRYDDAGHEYLTNTSAGVRIVAPPHPC